MLDFAASLIDDLLIPPAKDAEEHMKFVNRAWDVTKKCWDANPLLAEIIRELYDLNERRAYHPEEAEKIRHEFNLETIIKQCSARIKYEEPTDNHWIENPNKKAETGIENIKILNGNVKKYRTIISPNRDNGYPGNKCVWDLVNCLEHEYGRRVYTGLLGISPNYDIVIKMKLDEPMPVKDFLECASKTKNVEESYVDLISRQAGKQTPDRHVQAIMPLERLEQARSYIRDGAVR
ncbi:MAG: hypothetical protein U1E36_08675 [Rickettsiales bacterium]